MTQSDQRGGGAVGSAELASDPDQPEQADTGPRRRTRLSATPDVDPDQRGRAFDAARAHAGADAARADPDSGYWREVPRLQRMWADHAERWPPHAADRPPVSLRPERELEVDKAISRVRLIEPNVSAEMTEVARDNTSGAWLEAFDHRLKSDTRLKEKVSESATGSPDAAPAELLREIPDAIRYTFCASPDTYTSAYQDVKGRLENLGYEMYQCKNSWSNPQYKGINTRWVTQEGQRFEVQFHTPESFHAKHHITHNSYERLRNPKTDDVERGDLEAFQREISACVRTPDGVSGVLDFKKEGY